MGYDTRNCRKHGMGPPQAQKTLVLRPRTRQNVSRDHPIHTAQPFRESASNLTIQISEWHTKERADEGNPSSKMDESPPVNFRFGVCDLDTFHKVQRYHPRYGHIIPSPAPVHPLSASVNTRISAGAAKDKVVSESIGKTRVLYFGRGCFITEAQESRPTHPNGGYRVGEASNPGPSAKSGKPKPTEKQKHRVARHKDQKPNKASARVCDHKFCKVSHCLINGHYHQKKRKPAVGAKLREIQKLQAKNRAEGGESERAEPLFLLCRNPFGCDCDEDHFHDHLQLRCGPCVERTVPGDEEEKAEEPVLEDLADDLDGEGLADEPEQVADAQAPGSESELTHREPAIMAARGPVPQLELPVAHPVGGEGDQEDIEWEEFQARWDAVPEEFQARWDAFPGEGWGFDRVEWPDAPPAPEVRRFGGGPEWVAEAFGDPEQDLEEVEFPAWVLGEPPLPPEPLPPPPIIHRGPLPPGHELVYVYSSLPGERDAFDDSIFNRFFELFFQTDIQTVRNDRHVERYNEIHEHMNIGKKHFANDWYHKFLKQRSPMFKPRLSKRVHTDIVKTLGYNSCTLEVIYTPLYDFLWTNQELRHVQFVDDSNVIRKYYKGKLRVIAGTHESFATLSPKVSDTTIDYLFFQFVIRDFIGNARKGRLDAATAPGKEKPSVQKVILNGGGRRE